MDEQRKGIKNLAMQGGISYEKAQRLYRVLERNDWCIVESAGRPAIATTATLGQRLSTVVQFDAMPALVAWLQQHENTKHIYRNKARWLHFGRLANARASRLWLVMWHRHIRHYP